MERLIDHPDYRDLMETVHQNPEDHLPLHVLSDWLEENGRPAHAEMIQQTLTLGQPFFYHIEREPLAKEVNPFRHTASIGQIDDIGRSAVHLRIPKPNANYVVFDKVFPHDHAQLLHKALLEEGASQI